MYGHELVAALRASLADPDLATTESVPRRGFDPEERFDIDDGTLPPAVRRTVAAERPTAVARVGPRGSAPFGWREAAALLLLFVLAGLSVASMLGAGFALLFAM